MKTWKSFAILAFAAFPFSALAQVVFGGSDGGGGGVHVCEQPDGSLKADLVDLMEAEFYEKYVPSRELSKLPWRAQLNLAIDRISFADPELRQQLISVAKVLAADLTDEMEATYNTDYHFPTPQDLSKGRRVPPVKRGCEIVGGAAYNDEGNKLNISHLVWKYLSPRGKAALILHEVVYKVHRENNAEWKIEAPDSVDTRKLVGLAFSSVLDGRPEVRAEINRFKEKGDYRSYPLRPRRSGEFDAVSRENIARAKLKEALTPFSPYLKKQASRPLYVEEGTCKEGYTVVAEDEVDPVNRGPYYLVEGKMPEQKVLPPKKGRSCKLKWSVDADPLGGDADPGATIKPFRIKKTGKHTTKYTFKFDPKDVFYIPQSDFDFPQDRGILALSCEHKVIHGGNDDPTPDFKLYCGKRLVAESENNQGSPYLPIYDKGFIWDPKRAANHRRRIKSGTLNLESPEEDGEEADKVKATGAQ